jgi:hypothetical protein
LRDTGFELWGHRSVTVEAKRKTILMSCQWATGAVRSFDLMQTGMEAQPGSKYFCGVLAAAWAPVKIMWRSLKNYLAVGPDADYLQGVGDVRGSLHLKSHRMVLLYFLFFKLLVSIICTQ